MVESCLSSRAAKEDRTRFREATPHGELKYWLPVVLEPSLHRLVGKPNTLIYKAEGCEVKMRGTKKLGPKTKLYFFEQIVRS